MDQEDPPDPVFKLFKEAFEKMQAERSNEDLSEKTVELEQANGEKKKVSCLEFWSQMLTDVEEQKKDPNYLFTPEVNREIIAKYTTVLECPAPGENTLFLNDKYCTPRSTVSYLNNLTIGPDQWYIIQDYPPYPKKIKILRLPTPEDSASPSEEDLRFERELQRAIELSLSSPKKDEDRSSSSSSEDELRNIDEKDSTVTTSPYSDISDPNVSPDDTLAHGDSNKKDYMLKEVRVKLLKLNPIFRDETWNRGDVSPERDNFEENIPEMKEDDVAYQIDLMRAIELSLMDVEGASSSNDFSSSPANQVNMSNKEKLEIPHAYDLPVVNNQGCELFPADDPYYGDNNSSNMSIASHDNQQRTLPTSNEETQDSQTEITEDYLNLEFQIARAIKISLLESRCDSTSNDTEADWNCPSASNLLKSDESSNETTRDDQLNQNVQDFEDNSQLSTSPQTAESDKKLFNMPKLEDSQPATTDNGEEEINSSLHDESENNITTITTQMVENNTQENNTTSDFVFKVPEVPKKYKKPRRPRRYRARKVCPPIPEFPQYFPFVLNRPAPCFRPRNPRPAPYVLPYNPRPAHQTIPFLPSGLNPPSIQEPIYRANTFASPPQTMLQPPWSQIYPQMPQFQTNEPYWSPLYNPTAVRNPWYSQGPMPLNMNLYQQPNYPLENHQLTYQPIIQYPYQPPNLSINVRLTHETNAVNVQNEIPQHLPVQQPVEHSLPSDQSVGVPPITQKFAGKKPRKQSTPKKTPVKENDQTSHKDKQTSEPHVSTRAVDERTHHSLPSIIDILEAINSAEREKAAKDNKMLEKEKRSEEDKSKTEASSATEEKPQEKLEQTSATDTSHNVEVDTEKSRDNCLPIFIETKVISEEKYAQYAYKRKGYTIDDGNNVQSNEELVCNKKPKTTTSDENKPNDQTAGHNDVITETKDEIENEENVLLKKLGDDTFNPGVCVPDETLIKTMGPFLGGELIPDQESSKRKARSRKKAPKKYRLTATCTEQVQQQEEETYCARDLTTQISQVEKRQKAPEADKKNEICQAEAKPEVFSYEDIIRKSPVEASKKAPEEEKKDESCDSETKQKVFSYADIVRKSPTEEKGESCDDKIKPEVFSRAKHFRKNPVKGSAKTLKIKTIDENTQLKKKPKGLSYAKKLVERIKKSPEKETKGESYQAEEKPKVLSCTKMILRSPTEETKTSTEIETKDDSSQTAMKKVLSYADITRRTPAEVSKKVETKDGNSHVEIKPEDLSYPKIQRKRPIERSKKAPAVETKDESCRVEQKQKVLAYATIDRKSPAEGSKKTPKLETKDEINQDDQKPKVLSYATIVRKSQADKKTPTVDTKDEFFTVLRKSSAKGSKKTL